MSSLSIKAQNPPLLSKPSSFPAALIWSSFLHLGLSSLFIHASTKHVVSPDMREKGELDGERKWREGKGEDGADRTL